MAPAVDVRVSDDAGGACAAAARTIAEHLAAAVTARGVAHLALSGGSTGARLARALATEPVDWSAVHLWQVDERVAPDGDPARNATALLHELVERAHVPREVVHLMPVTEPDLAAAAAAYARVLPRLDVVHLGLGADGHTASWPPDQPGVATRAGDVTSTEPFNGHRRLTLTAPPVAAARAVVWVVCGADKRQALARVLAGDHALPATRALDARSVVFADRAAAPR